MAVTPNFSWPVPVATDYVKDGWEAISDLGNAIDTTVAGLGSGLNLITKQTFSAASTINVNDVFSATYHNYKILISCIGSVATTFTARMRVSGADNANSNYASAYFNWRSDNTGVGGTAANGTATSFTAFGSISDARRTNLLIDMYAPFASLATGYTGMNSYGATGYTQGQVLSGTMTVTTSYTGFTLLPASGNVTGTLWVYGYQES